jgi:hypothetical protein
MQDTKLAVAQGQEREWVEREQAAGGSSGGDGYHFICEVFFMTLQVGQTAWQMIQPDGFWHSRCCKLAVLDGIPGKTWTEVAAAANMGSLLALTCLLQVLGC